MPDRTRSSCGKANSMADSEHVKREWTLDEIEAYGRDEVLATDPFFATLKAMADVKPFSWDDWAREVADDNAAKLKRLRGY